MIETNSIGPYCLIYQAPLGRIAVKGDANHIHSLLFDDDAEACQPQRATWSKACRQQLDNYFSGKPVTFDLPLAPAGTEFQKRVWHSLCKVGYGALSSYLQLARDMGSPGAVRAVASANAKNPICILIPCHRVIGTDRALRGYAGGIERKAELLKLERHRLSDLHYDRRTRVLESMIE